MDNMKLNLTIADIIKIIGYLDVLSTFGCTDYGLDKSEVDELINKLKQITI